MKQQVVVIHGGWTFANYEEYLGYLKVYKIEGPEDLGRKDWKQNLHDNLGASFEVQAPRMPNNRNAKYVEWQIWFEKIIPFINDEVILTGHSLGGIFLTKYLSENKFPKKIKAAFLVAAPHDTEGFKESLADFILPKSLNQFSEQVEKIFLYQSKDDKVVPYAQVEKYKVQLPKAEFFVFEDKGHFNQPEFPELVTAIKSL